MVAMVTKKEEMVQINVHQFQILLTGPKFTFLHESKAKIVIINFSLFDSTFYHVNGCHGNQNTQIGHICQFQLLRLQELLRKASLRN